MRKTLRKGTRTCQIASPDDVGPGERVHGFADRYAAQHFLGGVGGDPESMMFLRMLLARDHLCLPLWRLSDQEVIAQLAWQLVTGRVMVIEQPAPEYRWASTAGAAPEKQDAPAREEKPAAAAAPLSQEQSWVVFRIVDDDTGEPVVGVRLKLRLPSGELREFRTGAGGKIEIKDLPPGTCDIEQMVDNEGLEVVEIH